MEIIEQSKYYQLQKHASSDTLLIVCSSLDTNAPNFTFYKLAQELGCHILFLNSPGSHWYRTGIIGIDGGLDGLVKKIHLIEQELNIKRIICFGASMGAYGAILIGSLAEVDKIIALSVEPLLGIPGGKTERTRNHLYHIYPDLRALEIPSLIVIYGAMDINDVLGAFLLSKTNNPVELYSLPYSEHGTARLLYIRNQLLPLLNKIIWENKVECPFLTKGNISTQEFNLLFNINNDYLKVKWKDIISKLTKHPIVVEKSLLLNYLLALAYYREGNFDLCENKLKEYLQKERQCSPVWTLLASCALKKKNYVNTLIFIDIAIELLPQTTVPYLIKFTLFNQLGKLDDAYLAIKKACLINPNYKNNLLLLNEIEKKLGLKISTVSSLEEERGDIRNYQNNLIGEVFSNKNALHQEIV